MKLYAIASTLFVLLTGYSWAAPGVQQQANVSPAEAASGGQSSYRPTESTPLPVRLIESEKEVAEKQAREAKSDKHEADDLIAQVRTADAAERQVFVGWAAIILSAIGTFAVLYTLKLSRKSLDAAVRSADAAEASAKSAQEIASASAAAFMSAERAWMEFDGIDSEPYGHPVDILDFGQFSSVDYKVRWVNRGRTPALLCGALSSDTKVAIHQPWTGSLWDLGIQQDRMVGPGREIVASGRLDAARIGYMRSKSEPLFIYSRVLYRDVFSDEIRVSEINLRVLPSDDGVGDVVRFHPAEQPWPFGPREDAQ